MNLLLPLLLAVGLPLAYSSSPPARPFPQHVTYTPGTILPSAPQAKLDATTAIFYDAWKARYLRPGCTPGQLYVGFNVDGHPEDKKAISVSEGHGYGMLLTALMAGHDTQAQVEFDQLYAWFRAHPSQFSPDLMAWEQVKGCVESKDGRDSATDGDLDIAYALLLADRQWGSAGPIAYLAEARKVIAAIASHEINPVIPSIQLGDWVQDAGQKLRDTRLSDFMPQHFRAFRQVTGAALWTQLIDREYRSIEWLQTQHAAKTGLLPDFALQLDSDQPAPAPAGYLETKFDGQYFYNACRVPWRIGLDYLVSGDARSKATVERINTFIISKTGGNPAKIRAGYELTSGKVLHESDSSLSFDAPFAVGAMLDSSHREWLDALWSKINSVPLNDDAAEYYGNTLKALCLVALSGNWWAP